MSIKSISKSFVFYILFTFALLFANSANVFAVCSLNGNLIVNGDAEADQSATGNNSDYDVSGWEPETGAFTVTRYNIGGGFPSSSDPGPANRGNFFFSGGSGGTTSSGTQTIDLSDCATQIDAGALAFNLNGYLGGFAGSNENAQLTLNFKNSSNAIVGTSVIGPVLAADRNNQTGLLQRSTSGSVPIGTRSVEAVLLMTYSSGSDNDGYADNLSFTVANPIIDSNQIIYSRAPNNSIDGNSATVWAINADGTDDHQITVGDQPRLSPDGNYLLFRRKPGFGGGQNYADSLWIRNMTTGAETVIYNNFDYIVNYDFAPTGEKIYFDYSCVIYKANYDGSGLQQIDGNCYDDAPTARKTDGLLTFHGFNGEIFISSADGSNRAAVPNTPGNNYSPSWSNDGQFIFYTHFDGSSQFPYTNDSLYKIKPDGTDKILLKTLTDGDRFGATGVASADDTKIYMPAKIGGVSGIYVVATDGSGTVSFAPVSSDLIGSGSNVDFIGGIAPDFTPTAANVSINGRVMTANGQGISNVQISLRNESGEVRSVSANSFGYYNFEEVAAGETYVLTIRAKRYSFNPATRVISILDNISDVNFIAN